MLKKDVKPYALVTPFTLPPLPLKGQVEEELKRMEALGVIRKVDIPQIGVWEWWLSILR